MTFSILTLVFLILVILIALFASTSHLMKVTFSSLISFALVGSYLYLEKSFSEMNSILPVASFINSNLSEVYLKLGLEESNHLLLTEMLYLFCLFLLVFSICYIVFSFLHIGGKIKSDKLHSPKRAIFLVFYLVFASAITLYFCAMISPLFKVEEGILEIVFDYIRGLVRL